MTRVTASPRDSTQIGTGVMTACSVGAVCVMSPVDATRVVVVLVRVFFEPAAQAGDAKARSTTRASAKDGEKRRDKETRPTIIALRPQTERCPATHRGPHLSKNVHVIPSMRDFCKRSGICIKRAIFS